MSKTIVIDAGHGGHDPGAVGPTGLRESDAVLTVAQAMEKECQRIGLQTILTRRDDTFIPLARRREIGDTGDALVSIHFNSAARYEAQGTETFAFSPGSAGARLGEMCQRAMVDFLGLADRGLKFQGFAVLRGRVPACLVEPWFIQNRAGEKMARDKATLEQLGMELAVAVAEFFGVVVGEDQDPPEEPSHPPCVLPSALEKVAEARMALDEALELLRPQ